MSDLAKSTEPARPLAPSDGGPRKRANPLKQLPKDMRQAVSFFYAAYSDVLKSPLGLVTRLRFFIASGLSLDDLKPVLRRMMEPDEQARFEFAGQLLAALAAKVAEVLEAKRLRERADNRRTAPPDAQEYAKILALLGKATDPSAPKS